MAFCRTKGSSGSGIARVSDSTRNVSTYTRMECVFLLYDYGRFGIFVDA